MMGRMWRTGIAGVLASALLGLSSASGAATVSVTTPTIARAVASAVRQNHLTSAAQASLQRAASDLALTNYPRRGLGASPCQTYGMCVYGDHSAKTTVALFGDSHAAMWLPALDPAAKKLHLRLVLTWLGACPTADVDPVQPAFGNPAYCNGFRKHADAQIIKGHPAMILLAEKTSQIPTGNAAYPWFPPSSLRKGLTSTIRMFQHAGIAVGILEDTPLFPRPVPACLSQHPHAITRCSVAFNDPLATALRGAEQSAAHASGVVYLATHQWLCTTVCPSVINQIVAYADSDHVSFTYAASLQAPFTVELKGALATTRTARG